jgi:hypothetical protein
MRFQSRLGTPSISIELAKISLFKQNPRLKCKSTAAPT